MIGSTFATFSRNASRRDSLLALGGAGLAAALGDVAGAAAKAKSGKRRKAGEMLQCIIVT